MGDGEGIVGFCIMVEADGDVTGGFEFFSNCDGLRQASRRIGKIRFPDQFLMRLMCFHLQYHQ